MPSIAILFLLVSALLHTTWNLLLKLAREKYIASWWMVVSGGIASLIGLFFTGLPPRQMWIFALFSVFAEAIYFLLLSYAYNDSDFSLVYPLARGAAPAFLAVWSIVLLHERPTDGGMFGLGLIICGLFIIGAGSLWKSSLRSIHFKGIAAALMVALLISIYTAIDGTAVKHGPTLPYALLVFTLIPLPVTPFILRQYRWSYLKQIWNEQRLRLSMIGLLGIIAYLFALAAYSIAPLSYSGAIREVSVVIGALAGWQFLKEAMGGMRLAGALVIFTGILMIAVLG
jgi:drug/metabolite transporter (DMT)-like permease